MAEPEAPSRTSLKALITTLVSIALSPLALVLGFYLNHLLQAPRLDIEYVSPIVQEESQALNPAVLKQVKEDSALMNHLHQTLISRAQRDNIHPATEWLDGGDWDDDYMDQVLKAVAEQKTILSITVQQIEPNLTKIAQWSPSTPLELDPLDATPLLQTVPILALQDKNRAIGILQSELRSAQTQLKDLDVLQSELDRLRQITERRRTGIAFFRLGVLNKGDSDGVVYRQAKVAFVGTTLPLLTESYVVVKSHSFAEIDF